VASVLEASVMDTEGMDTENDVTTEDDGVWRCVKGFPIPAPEQRPGALDRTNFKVRASTRNTCKRRCGEGWGFLWAPRGAYVWKHLRLSCSWRLR